jgi:hypothetical protein
VIFIIKINKMSVILKGGTSNVLADVDSNNNLKVNLPTVLSGAGYVLTAGEVDDGAITGTKIIRQMDVSQDYRLRTGIDKILWQDTYNHGVLNNSKYIGVTSVQTITIANGFLNLNAGNAVAATNVSRIQTYKTFSIFNTYPLYVDFKSKFSANLQANNVIEFGLGYATGTATPTDGVFFRAIGGQLYAVINNNGSETSIANVFVPVANTVYHYAITIGQDKSTFWVNDNIVATINTPSGLGSPCQSNALPLLLRNYNSGIVPVAIQLNIAQLGITLGDMDSGKDWATSMITNGQSSISAPDGQAAVAAGTYTANIVNNTAPSSIPLSNTTAGYATLGGQFQFAAVGGAETDYALFAYLNPAGTAAIPGKTLLITGIKIDTFNTVAAVATTATVLQWAIGIGGTAVTLLTADSVTAGTRAARRLGLGVQAMPIGTAIGGMASPSIDTKFAAPLMVEAGSYCHIILKMPIATATATEIIRGLVIINGYWE